MIVERVWEEMHKAKTYLIQVELYTDRMRKYNRIISFIIILASVVCASTAPYHNCKWVTIIASFLVAIATIIKECFPNLMQPESELTELDKIHDFYKEYLQKLEKLFTQRYDEKSDVDDKKMEKEFDKIIKTEGNNQSDLNRLCRKMTRKEREQCQSLASDYFQRVFNNNIKYGKQK